MLADLIARLEQASGPDREIDRDIEQYFKRGVFDPDFEGLPRPGSIIWPRYTASIDAALTLLPPGFWWRGGTCCVSSEAIVCPDHNDPQHREQLLRECPPSVEHWNSGIEVELRPGSPNALVRALVSACLRAILAKTEGGA